jgi:hypothetical protein
MAGNKIKVKSSEPKKSTLGKGIFSVFERRIKIESYFEEGFPVYYVPKIMFAMLLGILYISNTHYGEKTIRKINAIQAEVEDLRADYTTMKADLMYASKQSEVAKKVKDLGLRESLTPPNKIVIKSGEY